MLRAITLALLVLEGVAWADDPLAVARKAVAESDYLAARPALTTALASGGRSPEDMVEIYRLGGIVEAALGDARAATDAFTHLLALSPRAALPDGTSPKIRRPFDAAARYVAGLAGHAVLEVKTETRSDPPAITVVVASDPLNMVATVRAVFSVDGGAERTRDVEASERTDVPLPAGRRIDARIAALDAHGNRLIEIGSRDVPIVVTGEAPPPVVVALAPAPPPRRAPEAVHATARPVYLRWWPYAAGGVVFAGITGYFAWSVHTDTGELDRLNADSVHHSFGEARAAEDRARRDALFTNVGLGVTGAFALAAGVLYLTTPRVRTETRVTAVPVRGGGAVVLGGTF
ncbi:MAG TPA: hypothetical protein VGD37_22955 [Kofleriaceae bacterium]|jgi:hypothetical protein